MSIGIFAVDPPGEVEQQLVQLALQKLQVAAVVGIALGLVHLPYGPSMYRRGHGAENPFLSWNMTNSGHVPDGRHQQEFIRGEHRVENPQRDTVESQIPCCL